MSGIKKSPAKKPAQKQKAARMPAVDGLEPGFSFRWPENYDFVKYAYKRPFARLPRAILCRTGPGDDIRPGVWADLSLSAKAVLIILLRHANLENISFPSTEVICAKSGINSRKTTKRASDELKDALLLKIEKYTTVNGKRAKRYILSPKHFCREETDYLPSYHHHVEAGYWAMMGYKRPSAQALYWAIRLFARPRPDMVEDGWIDFDRDEGREWLANRDGDVCAADRDVLCDFAGITPRTYPVAMQSLRHMRIIKDMHDYPDRFFLNFQFDRCFKAKILHSYLRIT